jgi:hypothetical protein
MSQKHSNSDGELPITRRSALKSLGAAGAGVSLFSGTVSSQEKTKTIVVARAGDRPVRTKDVPADWYREKENASEAVSELKSKLLSDNQDCCGEIVKEKGEGVFGIGVRRSDGKIGGRYGFKIRVQVKKDQLPPILKDHINEIPVEVEQTKNTLEPQDCNEDTYTPVPGGVSMSADGGATVTSKAWDMYGNPGALVCAHVFNQNFTCDNNLAGESATQGGNKMGEVPSENHFSHDDDFAFLDKTGNETSGYKDAIEGVVDDVRGYKTKDGLYDLQSIGETVYQFGRTTCETSGQITGVENHGRSGTGWCYATNQEVQTDISTDSGDSGGPLYTKYFDKGDYEYRGEIIAPLYGADSEGARGAAAYHIYDSYGIRFTPP